MGSVPSAERILSCLFLGLYDIRISRTTTQISELRHDFWNSREWVELGRIAEFAEFDPPMGNTSPIVLIYSTGVV